MRKLFGLVLVMVFLSGCAATTVKFDPVANRNIRTIGLIEVQNPVMKVIRSASTEQFESSGQLGLLPLLVLAAGRSLLPTAQKEAEGILTKEISDSGFNFGRQINEELVRALRNANYEVVVISPNEIGKVNADAYLSVVYQGEGVGYRYIGTGNDVLPFIWQNTRLTSKFAEPKEDVFYSSQIVYGETFLGRGATTTVIPPPSRYHFDLTKPENKPLIIEGLQAGITAIAEKVAADLRK